MSGLPDSLTAALADRYRLERELGAGGMATVYLAADVKHNRQVAIKVLRDDLTASLGAERFHREISIAAGLTHPHILPLHDSGSAANRLFYVMPYVEGQSLRQKLAKEGELPIGDAVRILRDVADAMAHAHARGVVHRDLKPENIMLSGRHALVTDFGVAKAVSEATGRQTLTTAGVALGTPSYMSPEQATADPHTDHRSDIYSFGVMAYELLTGHTPFGGRSPQEVLAAHVTAPVPPITQHRASIPAPLADLVMRCLEKKPADRPQSAEELVPALEALLTPSGGITPTATAPYVGVKVPGPAGGGRRAVLIAVGAVIIAGAAFATWRARPAAKVDTRVVVAWLDNKTGDTSYARLGSLAAEWIADGLSREGISTVIPASVVRELMDGEIAKSLKPVEELVKRTNATIVVTGRVDRRGDSLEYRVEARDVAATRVIANVGPFTGGKDETKPFDQLFEQVLIALSDRRNFGNRAQWQRPRSLAAYREFITGANDYFAVGRAREAIPFVNRAIALDSAWLMPWTMLLAIYGNAADNDPQWWHAADSVRALAVKFRAAAPEVNQLAFDWVTVRHDGDHEGQYRVGKRRFELDSSDPYVVVLPAGRTGRAREVLKYAALFDTTLHFARSWRANFFYPLWAMHALRRYDDELAAARQYVARFGLDLFTAGYVIRPLAAMGRYAEVDSVLTSVRNLPVVGRTTFGNTLSVAAAEYRAHDADSARTHAIFESRVRFYEALPPPDRARLAGALANAQLMLGDAAAARPVLDSIVGARPDNAEAIGMAGVAAVLLGDQAAVQALDARLQALARPHLFGDNVVWQSRMAAARGDCARATTLLQSAMRSQNYSDPAHHWWASFGKGRDCKSLQTILAPRD